MILSDGHTCDGGNRTLRWSQFCDGIIDCYDRFDEEGHFCKRCINNSYSCPPQDDLRCDLACKMLHYVPCQTIQDRRACNIIQTNYDDDVISSFFQLFNEFKFYIVAIISILLILIGIIIFIKYFRRCRNNSRVKSSNLSVKPNCPIESDTLSSHIYEQCDETSSYKFAQKYPYYEHVI